MSAKIEPCPKCGKVIGIFPVSGGRGTGEMTEYRAECSCGMKAGGLGMGSMRSAVSDWNKYAKAERIKHDGDHHVMDAREPQS